MLTQANVGNSSNTDRRQQQMDHSMRRHSRNSSLRESTGPGRKSAWGYYFPFFTGQKLLSVSLCELKSQSLSPQRPQELKVKINNNLCQHHGWRKPKDGVFGWKSFDKTKKSPLSEWNHFIDSWDHCHLHVSFRTEPWRITGSVNTELHFQIQDPCTRGM